MKILVTGGAGFIASHLVDAYLKKGYRVDVFDDLSTGSEKNLNPKAKFYRVDICSKKAAELLIKIKPDILNHHAAQINLRKSVANPLLDAKINILGLINLMQAALKTGSLRKLVFASTGGAIYGDAKVLPTPEDYPAWPVSPYGVAKLSCEHYLHYYRLTYGVPFVSLRYGNVYGPRQNPHGEAGVVAIFADRMLNNKKPVINGSGTQTRDYVFVDDVVTSNLLATETKVEGIYNIGNGVETDVNTIYKKMAALLAFNKQPLNAPPKKGEQQRSALDCSRAKKYLSWNAKTDMDHGLKKTLEFFKSQSQ